jgi:NADP-dependent 3-hydroxy acid dehydrogenase YdfG
MPVRTPTSCAFGGPDLKTLFITTASITMVDKRWVYMTDAQFDASPDEAASSPSTSTCPTCRNRPSPAEEEDDHGDGQARRRTAIVTGAARGIGAAIATVLADAGAAVISSTATRPVETVAERIRAGGREARAMAADVSVKAELASVAEAALAWRGRIDIVCPNAAIFDSSPLVDMSEELWDRVLGVNLKGVFLTVQACAPAMIRQGYGRVVATSSITGSRTAIAGMAHYAASKAGINSFVRAAAINSRHGTHQRHRTRPRRPKVRRRAMTRASSKAVGPSSRWGGWPAEISPAPRCSRERRRAL